MPTAGQPFTREDLMSLKRADIQKLCKDYGVRANMKTEALVELLLDSLRSNMSPLVGPRRPQQAPAPRRVSTRSSTRVSSLRSRGTSGSSSSTSFVTTSSHVVSVGSPQTNKSKLTQHRLGVGRPSVAAGSGTRHVSRSTSSSKVNRGRVSRSYKPPEATIDEEPEISQSTPMGDRHAGPSSSGANGWSNSSTADNNDVPTRVGRLESMFRDTDIKRQLDSLREVRSQVAYLKTSVQQREAEIMGIRGELNVCKAEVLELRGEVSKIPFLEGQLRAIKETLDQLAATSSGASAKSKTPRRVSTPLGDSNVNSTPKSKTTPLLNATTIQAMQPKENPLPIVRAPSVPSDVALGKRPFDATSNEPARETAIRVNNPMVQESNTGRIPLPDRKRARTGTSRRPFQEKVIEPRRGPERPAPDHEGGEDCAASAGSSASGPSTQPSVSTPPPAPPAVESYSDFDAHQGELRSDEIDMLDFCQAASSTPRDDIFNFFDGETFSQLSATKLGARIAGLDTSGPRIGSPRIVQQEPRRISTAVARPRTPTRPSGPARFRVAADSVSPVREDVASPFDPYSEAAFGLPFGPGVNDGANYARRDVHTQNQNQGFMPAPMPLPAGFGLGSAVGNMISDESPPGRPAPRTMYGTELQNDTRFGDFGRDGIASASNMEFWNNF